MNIDKEYKGIYIQDNNKTIKYYEHGAHFSYKALYKRLEQIYRINNKIKEPYEKLFRNLKKANSQKVIRHKSNKVVKISRNTKVNHNSIYNNINNNAKLYNSKSIQKLLNYSKSYNEEQFGSFILNKIKNINLKKSKDIFHKNNNIKLNESNKTRINKKSLKNNHTVLKCVIIPKKNINKKENIVKDNYYEMSTNKIIDVDTDINGYGDISYNSLCNNYNNKINICQIDMNNKSQNKNLNHNSKKYEKIKKYNIINKRFVQNLINDSPKNNSTFLSINNSSYYSQSKTQRTSENNNINFSSCKRQKKSCIKKFNSNNNLYNIKYSKKNLSKNKIIENNYYIENTRGNGLYNTNINKNILLSNNIKQKNKKLTIYNLFNKMNFQKYNTNIINFFNNHNQINDLLLEEKERNNNSNKNSIIRNKKIKQKNNCKIQTKEDKEVSIKNYNNYNSSSNFKKKNDIKRKLKNNHSQNNFLKINVKNSINTPHNKDNNKDSLTFFVGEHCSNSENKKSRNNAKGIVNLLCCHFSININSPINLLNNIQGNVTNNNKTQKINTTFGNNNINNYNQINNLNKNKKIENKELKFHKLKTNIIKTTKRKYEKIKEKSNIIQKIKKIPIKITKEKTTKMKSNISNINYIKANKSCFKKKLEQNITKNRYNSSKRIIEKKAINNSGNISKINDRHIKKIYKLNNDGCGLKNTSTNSKANINNNNNNIIFLPGDSFFNERIPENQKLY